MTIKATSTVEETPNCLVNQQPSQTKPEQFYDYEKTPKADFSYVIGPESHLTRRKLILEQHPEIAKLLVPTKPYSIILALILVPLNLFLCYLVKDASWPIFFLTAYICGGTIGHTCHVLIHDFTHWAGHSNILLNKVLAIFCNIAMGIPSAMGFGVYHSDHHNYLGEEDKDPDLPTRWEVKHFQSKASKIFFFTFLSLIYALRPFLFMHKRMSIDEIMNFVVIFCCDLLIYKFWGGWAFIYIIISGFTSIGAHPAAIHVIAEHHEFAKGVETYDYFGIWNFFNLNLGYHIEHHDFPTCPWYNLPAIRAAAPEWYEYIPHHTSYTKVLQKFLFDDNFNLFQRTLRIPNKKAS